MTLGVIRESNFHVVKIRDYVLVAQHMCFRHETTSHEDNDKLVQLSLFNRWIHSRLCKHIHTMLEESHAERMPKSPLQPLVLFQARALVNATLHRLSLSNMHTHIFMDEIYLHAAIASLRKIIVNDATRSDVKMVKVKMERSRCLDM